MADSPTPIAGNPLGLSFGKVVGRFLSVVGDSPADEDTDPDVLPMAGTVTFTPSVNRFLAANATPDPVTAVSSSITATLDSKGYLSYGGQRGVYLVATDTTGINPSGGTYSVSLNLRANGSSVSVPSFSIEVPTFNADGDEVDLTTTSPVPSSSGDAIVRGPAGIGVPDGGTAGQALVKASSDDGDTKWVTVSGVGSDVTSVNGATGDVTVDAASIGLGNVDNTADTDKPVSNATQTALDAKQDSLPTDGSAGQFLAADLTWQTPTGTGGGGGTGDGTVTSVNDVEPNESGNVDLSPSDIGAATDDQGAKADSAVQPTDLAAVATSGSYNDLSDQPAIPATPTLASLGGVPTTRKVNGHALSADVTLTASDVSALAASTTAADLGAATSDQGAKADSAVQPDDLAVVATSGDYDDLDNKPDIPAAQVSADWNATTGVAQILNKPDIPSAAADVGAVPTTRTVAGHALSDDVTLDAADVGLGNVTNVAILVLGPNDPVPAGTQAGALIVRTS